jgi:hypothetical protein
MLVGPGYLELVHEIAGLPPGSRVGLVCASERGAENMLDVLRLAGTPGIEILHALTDDPASLKAVDDAADLILMSREALAAGLDLQVRHHDRVRSWTYEFDPSGLELLRRAIERVEAERPAEVMSGR